jgi:hypothetical protein
MIGIFLQFTPNVRVELFFGVDLNIDSYFQGRSRIYRWIYIYVDMDMDAYFQGRSSMYR